MLLSFIDGRIRAQSVNANCRSEEEQLGVSHQILTADGKESENIWKKGCLGKMWKRRVETLGSSKSIRSLPAKRSIFQRHQCARAVKRHQTS